MKALHDVQPLLLERTSIGYVVRWNLNQVTVEDGVRWECDEVIASARTYDAVVSALIHSKYDIDRELATINNHLIGQDEDEWQEYQAWRAWAKEYAGTTLGLE